MCWLDIQMAIYTNCLLSRIWPQTAQDNWWQRDLLSRGELQPWTEKKLTFSYMGVKRNFSNFASLLQYQNQGFFFYHLFPYIHHLDCSPQFLNVLGCHFHHFLNLSTFFRPCRHTFDLHPFCQALRNKKKKKDVVWTKPIIIQTLKST